MDLQSDSEFIMPDGWRGTVLARIRRLMREVDPDVSEEVKYRKPTNPNGVLVWYCNGMISTGEVYKNHLRLTLSQGEALKEFDVDGVINSHRAIMITEDYSFNEEAFLQLMRIAVRINKEKKAKK